MKLEFTSGFNQVLPRLASAAWVVTPPIIQLFNSQFSWPQAIIHSTGSSLIGLGSRVSYVPYVYSGLMLSAKAIETLFPNHSRLQEVTKSIEELCQNFHLGMIGAVGGLGTSIPFSSQQPYHQIAAFTLSPLIYNLGLAYLADRYSFTQIAASDLATIGVWVLAFTHSS